MENLSLKIRELRKETGISQAELAKKMDLQFYNIGNWEQGRSEPSVSDLIKLADIFNISLDELVNREPLQNPFVSIKKNKIESFSPDELDLIKFYRAIDKPSKLAIFTTAKSFYNQLPKEKRISDSI